MTLNKFNNINEDEFCRCCNDLPSNLKNFTKNNPLVATVLVAGSTLTTASIISPTMRKFTVPTCKFIAKQQLKFLAGIGVLSIATYISSQSNGIDDTLL